MNIFSMQLMMYMYDILTYIIIHSDTDSDIDNESESDR